MSNLNLEFSRNLLRILMLNESGDTIIQQEAPLSFNLSEESCQKRNRDELSEEFFDKILECMPESISSVRNGDILINTDQAFLNVFPIDFTENQDSINGHILWELSNYFPDTYKDFNIKYYRLNNNYLNKDLDEALIIAINKNKIDFIKRLLNSCNIRIKSIEIDQFAVEKCVSQKSNMQTETECSLILGCKSQRIDFSLLHHEKLRYYDYQLTENLDFRNALVDQMNFFTAAFNGYKIGQIFLYGSENVIEIKNFLEEQFKFTNVYLINCTSNKLNISDNQDKVRFAPLMGLALKNL